MSSLAIGIVGLPNVGKSTLFNALTNNTVLAANYPFATIDPNVGVVAVPDERLDKLATMFQPDRVTPTTINFLDIAGLVAGAHQGEGLGNQFLSHIREVDAIAQVVRSFENDHITHVAGEIDPASDIATINTELILADLATVKNRLEKTIKQTRGASKSGESIKFLERLETILDSSQLISKAIPELDQLSEAERVLLRELNLLTAKPFIYVFNTDEAGLQDRSRFQELESLVAPAKAVLICADLEAQLSALETKEQQELLDEYGQQKPGLELLIQAGYETLGLITFLTAGPKEARAWTLKRGAKAPAAAGVIHTDFERGFIAAEVVSFPDLVAAGSLSAARAQGKLRTEGKEYVMRDGDVVEFRFNV